MKLPILDLELSRPTRASVAWYAGLSAMAATGLLEWPLAAIVAAGHLVEENSRSQAVEELAEGVESGAG